MSDYIRTPRGEVRLVDVPLYHGRKIINRDVCKSNLLDFKEVLDRGGVGFYLCFGTLLGAVRENNFIEHDEDVDVVIRDEDREKFLLLLIDLVAKGFDVVRYENDLLSIIKNGDYIDIYFFKKTIYGNFLCNNMSIPGRYFESSETIGFLGVDFKVPVQYFSLLAYLYGENWRTPVLGQHASPLSVGSRFRQWVKIFLPSFAVDMYKKIRK